MQKVSLVLVTYNPDFEQLTTNLSRYIKTFDSIIIADNSENSDDLKVKLSQQFHFSDTLIFISSNGNKGIAFAQNRGVEKAIELGSEYVVEVDQDTTLPDEYLPQVKNSYEQLIKEGQNVLGIGPIAIRDTDSMPYHGLSENSGVIIRDKTLSSGFFYPASHYKLLGPKDERLFIDLVDWEWCWRAKNLHGLSTFIDTSIPIRHMLGDGHFKFFGKEIGKPSVFRLFYQYRNSLLLLRSSHVPTNWKFKRMLVLMGKYFFYSVAPGYRLKAIRSMSKGVLHGILNK